MTFQDWNMKQLQRLEELRAYDQPLFLGASTVAAMQSTRIFTDGKATDGASIGRYDTTKQLYVNPKNAPVSFAPKGKTGKSSFKNGDPHKTGYFKSYAAFRTAQGRQTGNVDLNLFGTLKSEWENSLKRDPGDPHVYTTGLSTEESKSKAIGNQKRFGKAIFALSQEEKEEFTRIVQLEFNSLHQN